MRKIGYTRTTINEPDATEQVQRLTDFGVDEIVAEIPQEKNNTCKTTRLESLLAEMTPGDILTVTQLNRLGRSTRQLAELTTLLKKNQLHLISLKETINTVEDGTLYFDFMQHLADMECDLIKERTLVGLNEARKKGKIGGRPKIDPKVVKKIRRLYYEKKETIQWISNKCHVSVGTCYKYINLSEEDLEKIIHS